MSGGAFLDCYDDKERAEKIIEQLRDPWTDRLEPRSISRLIDCYHVLRRAAVKAHRADWYISGDDGDDSYKERLENDLAAMERDSEIEVNNLISYRKAKGWTV